MEAALELNGVSKTFGATRAVEHLDLAAGPHGWADAIERIAAAPRENPDSWLATMAASRFGIRRCVEELDQIYRTAIERAA